MLWSLSHHRDPASALIADRHYSRQTPGSDQFMPPGRKLVLSRADAVWGTSWPFAQYVRHQWAGAMLCCLFRNEGECLSSSLIRDALAATRWRYPELPALGMVTFINAAKVRHKRDPGRCFLRAGFIRCGETKGGLIALQILPEEWPDPEAPLGTSKTLWGES